MGARLAFCLCLPLTLAACDPADLGLRAPVEAMPDAAEGAVLYAEHCAACHGETGKGDGPSAAGMRPAPSDLTRIAARHGGTLDRAKTLSTLDGYTRAQRGAVVMPEFGAVLEGDTVPVTLNDGSQSPVPRPLAALLFYIESLQPETN